MTYYAIFNSDYQFVDACLKLDRVREVFNVPIELRFTRDLWEVIWIDRQEIVGWVREKQMI